MDKEPVSEELTEEENKRVFARFQDMIKEAAEENSVVSLEQKRNASLYREFLAEHEEILRHKWRPWEEWDWFGKFAGAEFQFGCQLAVLDLLGATRGTVDTSVDTLREVQSGISPQIFNADEELAVWRETWPQTEKPSVKMIYDKTGGELHIMGRSGETQFEETLAGVNEENLTAALEQAQEIIANQMKYS